MKKILFLILFSPILSEAQIITTYAGNNIAGYGGDGIPATSTSLNRPEGLTFDITGNLCFADKINDRIRIINSAGIILTIAGSATAGYTGDGGLATNATLHFPDMVSYDKTGNLYIADNINHCIRKIDVSGTITTVAGNGVYGYSGDGGIATNAKLSDVTGVAADGLGNFYIADNANSLIRVVNSAGIINTFAGTPYFSGHSGDGGQATAAKLIFANAVKIDSKGNLYISEGTGNYIRKVNPAGVISTIAGNGSTGYIGDGGPATTAKLYWPNDIAIDKFQNVYIADYRNNVIRKVDTFGIISTVVGNGYNAGIGLGGYTGDGGPATNAELSYPSRIEFDASGNLYISDEENNVVRKVTSPCQGSPTAGSVLATVLTGCSPYTSVLSLSGSTEAGGILYQWKSSSDSLIFSSIVGATSNSYSATVTAKAYYKCIVTCSGSGLSDSTAGGKLIVNPLPFVPAITGASSLCAASSIPLTDATIGGIWTSSNTNASVSSGGLVTGISAGLDTIIYSVSNICGTTTTSATMNIIALPNAGTITGGGSVCVGATTTLTDASSGGFWNISNTTASVSGGLVTGISSGTDTISYIVSNVCGTASSTHSVAILPLPNAGIIIGLSLVCAGANIILSDPAGGGGGTWNSSNGNASVVAGIVIGISTGTSIISYNVTNSCGTATATHIVATSSFVPTTAPITGTSNEFCAGTSITLMETTSGGVWSSGCGCVYVAGGIVRGLSGGTATITYSIVNGCGSATSTYAVTVDPLPNPGYILGQDHACQGFTIIMADNISGGTWSSVDSSIASIAISGIVSGVGAGSTFIVYTTTNACGKSTVKYPFTVLPSSECISEVLSPITTSEETIIYPNPATTELIIASNEKISNVIITNMFGQKIHANYYNDKLVHLDITKLPLGIYFVKVNNSMVGKFVKH
jgi:hypothetical protein